MKRGRSACETRSHKDQNTFALRVKRVRSACDIMYIHPLRYYPHLMLQIWSHLPRTETCAGGFGVPSDHCDAVHSGVGQTAQQGPSLMHARLLREVGIILHVQLQLYTHSCGVLYMCASVPSVLYSQQRCTYIMQKKLGRFWLFCCALVTRIVIMQCTHHTNALFQDQDG